MQHVLNMPISISLFEFNFESLLKSLRNEKTRAGLTQKEDQARGENVLNRSGTPLITQSTNSFIGCLEPMRSYLWVIYYDRVENRP